jgi:hypothetical protein
LSAHSSSPHQFSLYYLFEVITPADLVTVVLAALLERKILFVSSRHALLTLAAEAVRALLYPFVWRHVYIPVLPVALIECVGACCRRASAVTRCDAGVCAAAVPAPYIMGVHTSLYDSVRDAASEVRPVPLFDRVPHPCGSECHRGESGRPHRGVPDRRGAL